MTVTLAPEVERAARERAARSGQTVDQVVNAVLEAYLVGDEEAGKGGLGPSVDEWERLLDSIGVETGVVLTDEQVSSDGIYED